MTEPVSHKLEPSGERNGSTATATPDVIRTHIKQLLSSEYEERSSAMVVLRQHGAESAQALVQSLTGKTLESNLIAIIEEVLESIGKPAIDALTRALAEMPEVESPQQAHVLGSLVTALGRINDRGAAPTLLDQIAKLKRAIKRNGNTELVDACEATRVRIHGFLSQLGNNSGLNDLLTLLGDGKSRIRDGIVRSISRIGDRRALLPLIRLHLIESEVSSAGAQLIRDTARDIARREQVSLDDPLFEKLNVAERAELEKVFSKPRNGNGNGHSNGNGKH